MPAEPVSLASLPALGATLIVGGYIVLQGHLSPGGGFQGGIVVSAAALLIGLSGGAASLFATLPKIALEVLEAVGIGVPGVWLSGPGRGSALLDQRVALGGDGRIALHRDDLGHQPGGRRGRRRGIHVTDG